jgi:transposase-like protein/IS1 family transposase
MTCHNCRIETVKAGRAKDGAQRHKCQQCGKRFTDAKQRLLGSDSRLPEEKTLMILRCLLEGNSVRSTGRLCEVEPNTVLNILVLTGERCERLLGKMLMNITVKDVQADEIWSFIGKKEKQRQPGDDPNVGDAYTFVAIERHSKLVLNFALGKRDQLTTNGFIEGLRLATSPKQFQVTTDGFAPYVSAMENTLADRVDFARLIKVYRATPEGERRYSPAEVVSTETVIGIGNPDPKRVCTSHVERQNLSMRMGIRRFTRLTNAFSKKWENHWAALCVWFAYYNFCRVHQSLRVTPAMAAGISDHIWSVRELLEAA